MNIDDKERLNNVLESIVNSSFSVKEIIISIPENKNLSISKELINESNIKIIKTKFSNQIRQRIEGFKIASGKYIIQLDSDVILDKFCIENLHKSLLNITENASVGALIMNVSEGKKTIKHGFLNIIVNFKTMIMGNDQDYARLRRCDRMSFRMFLLYKSQLMKLSLENDLANGFFLSQRLFDQ